MPAPIPAWFTGFLDDASAFPPAAVPLPEAAAAYARHRRGSHAALVGALSVPDVRLPDLIDALDEDAEPLPVTVVVTGGAGALGPAVRWATRAPVLALRSLEVVLRDEEDLAHNVRRFTTALDACEDDVTDVRVCAQLPPWSGSPSYGWLSALDELASAGLLAQIRPAGIDPAAVVAAIDASLDRELPLRVTGLEALSGPAGYGFVNLLVATRCCLDGKDAAAALVEESPTVLLDGWDEAVLNRTRNWLVGVGSPDVVEAHDDLIAAGILS